MTTEAIKTPKKKKKKVTKNTVCANLFYGNLAYIRICFFESEMGRTLHRQTQYGERNVDKLFPGYLGI